MTKIKTQYEDSLTHSYEESQVLSISYHVFYNFLTFSLFYIIILVILSFPLGSFANLILLIAYHIINPVLSIKLENIIFSILVTIISSISFYYQWYVLFPKLSSKFIKFKNNI